MEEFRGEPDLALGPASDMAALKLTKISISLLKLITTLVIYRPEASYIKCFINPFTLFNLGAAHCAFIARLN